MRGDALLLTQSLARLFLLQLARDSPRRLAMLLASGLYGYAALSAVVTGAVIANAVTAREQFYSTVVHLTTSKGSLMVRIAFRACRGRKRLHIYTSHPCSFT